MNCLTWTVRLLQRTHYDSQRLTMITFPSKDKLKNSSYFLVFIHFLDHQQKCLLGKLVTFIVVALTLVSD